MKTFRLDPAGFKEVRRRLLIRSMPMMVIACAAGLYISTFNQDFEVNILPFIVPLLIGVLVYSHFKSVKLQRKMWNSYELTIEGYQVSRSKENAQTIVIDKNEIDEILETPQGHIFIKTANSEKFIDIPVTVLERDELLKEISAFGNIKQGPATSQNLASLTVIVVVILMVTFGVSKNKTLIILSGSLLLIGLTWSWLKIRKSMVIDERSRRLTYLVAIPLLAIAFRLYYILLG